MTRRWSSRHLRRRTAFRKPSRTRDGFRLKLLGIREQISRPIKLGCAFIDVDLSIRIIEEDRNAVRELLHQVDVSNKVNQPVVRARADSDRAARETRYLDRKDRSVIIEDHHWPRCEHRVTFSVESFPVILERSVELNDFEVGALIVVLQIPPCRIFVVPCSSSSGGKAGQKELHTQCKSLLELL